MKEWHGDDIEDKDVVEEAADDVELEQDGDAVAADATAKVSKLKEEIATLRKEKQEYMDGWQRAKADYVNLLKRFEVETKAGVEKGKVKAIETLLPAFDALERAKEHGEVPEGFTAIARQLESAFASLGLTEVGQVGEAFDPTMHEAFGQDATDDVGKDDTVTAILEKGWRIAENIIRVAKVRVAHFASEK